MLAGNRLAIVLAIAAFMLVSAILSSRVDRRIGRWSSQVLVVGLIAARFGHVVLHHDSFIAEPWRVVAIWQGGFSMLTGLAGALVVTALHVRSPQMAFATASALGIAALIWIAVGQLSQASVGQPAPTQAFQQLNGAPIRLGDAGGQPTVVNIWATWCPPCRREMPTLAEVGATRRDVTFVFANQGESPDQIKSYLAAQQLTLAHIILDRELALPRHYGTPGIPVTLFLRGDGRLMTAHVGEISREVLNGIIDRLTNSN